MKISILCNSQKHPIIPTMLQWIRKNEVNHSIELLYDKAKLNGGDILFLISCADIIPKLIRAKYSKTLVIHASDLPLGRGWSPHVWEILEGKEEITVTLLEAEDKVDSGDIWKKIKTKVNKDMLYDEINERLFKAELELMSFALANFHSIKPKPQDHSLASYYRKRTPKDSQIDIHQSIESQFNLLRICDPERYPAYFTVHGQKYILTLRKVDQ